MSIKVENPCATRAISHGLKKKCADQEGREKEEEHIDDIIIKVESVIDGRLRSD